jgi:hypothetical protein
MEYPPMAVPEWEEAGAETDARVARSIMGWRHQQGEVDHLSFTPVYMPEWWRFSDYAQIPGYHGGIPVHLWHPSTDREQAMCVLDAFDAVDIEIRRREGGTLWQVEIAGTLGWAATLPLAVCRAALRAIQYHEGARA